MQFSHLQIGIAVIALVTLIGVIISFIQKSKTYAGYDDIKAELPRIVSFLKGDTFRDGDDLVITGNYKKFPVQIRFSYSENTPGLNVRMQAPVSFTVSVVPKGERATEGRVLIKTGDDMFDARFATRTDHPTQAKLVVGSKAMRSNIEKLCCSSKTFLTMTTGAIELSELVIPEPYTGRHVMDHIESMGILATMSESIPGAENIKIRPYEREKSMPVFRIVLAVGSIVALAFVFVVKPTSASPDLSELRADAPRAQGVMLADSGSIGLQAGFHVATVDEFSSSIEGFVRTSGNEPSGRITLEFDSVEQPQDVVYWLRDADGKNRVILLKNGENVFDTYYKDLVGIARIPAANVNKIDWKIKPAEEAEGDAVLLILRSGESFSGLVLYPGASRIFTGRPVNFESIDLR